MSLEMYLEGYHNVIDSIKELKNTPNNETRIAELEKVIEENQQKIYDWKVKEGDEKQFEEYMAPFNKEITDAEKEIKELTATKEANAELRAKNTTEAEEKKKYLENIRENAKKQYEENKKSFEDEWQKGSLREEYEDLSQKLEQAKKDKEIFEKPNRTKEEQIGYEHISKKILATYNRMAQIKREFNTKKQVIENEYNEFLKEADRLDEEAGIVTKQAESQELESEQLPENENATSTPVEHTTQSEETLQPAKILRPTRSEEKTQPDETTPSTRSEETLQPAKTLRPAGTLKTTGETRTSESTNTKIKNKENKVNIEVSASGIRINGKSVDEEELNELLNEKDEQVQDSLDAVLGMTKALELNEKGDLMVIASLMVGEDMMGETVKSRLNKYYDLINNPDKKEESKMKLTYNLKNMSFVSRLLGKCKLDKDTVKEIKENAYNSRAYADIEAGILTKLSFKIKDMLDKSVQKAIESDTKKEENTAEKQKLDQEEATTEKQEHGKEEATQADKYEKMTTEFDKKVDDIFATDNKAEKFAKSMHVETKTKKEAPSSQEETTTQPSKEDKEPEL